MLYMVTGFLTGILGGLFGVGGGEIFIPLLIYVYGFSQHQALERLSLRLAGDPPPVAGTSECRAS